MAKLSSHGREIGRITYTTYQTAYRSDGKVLKNSGMGWKLYKQCKPGVDPEQAYANARAKQDRLAIERPALTLYRKELHKLTGIGKAWKLHAAIELMPQDPDGVWSECCDGYGDNVHADIDEVANVCRLYELALSEMKESVSA